MPFAKFVSIVVSLSLVLLGGKAKAEPGQTAKRPAWTTSRVKGRPEPPLPYRAERVFPHLRFQQPTVLTNAPGTERLFVAEHSGRISSIPDDRDCRNADLFLDVNALVKRLNASLDEEDQVAFVAVYGLTFHPVFSVNRRCYVCYVVCYKDRSRGQHPHGTRVVELLATDSNPPAAVGKSEKEIITWLEGGHNGGCLKFGPDGMLYISTGDGRTAFPPDERNSGQDVTNLLAAVLRIDVNKMSESKPYAIPPDNPFAAAEAGKPSDADQGSSGRMPLPKVPEGVHPTAGKTNIYTKDNLKNCGYALRNWLNFLAVREVYFRVLHDKGVNNSDEN